MFKHQDLQLLNFQPREVVSRYRDPQLQVAEIEPIPTNLTLWKIWIISLCASRVTMIHLVMRALCWIMIQLPMDECLANTIHWPNALVMLGQHRRRWASIKSTLSKSVVYAAQTGMSVSLWVHILDPIHVCLPNNNYILYINLRYTKFQNRIDFESNSVWNTIPLYQPQTSVIDADSTLMQCRVPSRGGFRKNKGAAHHAHRKIKRSHTKSSAIGERQNQNPRKIKSENNSH